MSLETSAQRREQQRADARRAIQEAAESLLAEGGYEVFSIRKLAERCGYTAPTIYHYFGDKAGLVDVLLEERFADLITLIEDVGTSPDPFETIRARAQAFVRFGLENPTHYHILASQRAPTSQPLKSAEEARALLEQPWRQLIEQGTLAPENLDVAQQCLFALCHGIISLRASRDDIDWSPKILEESVDALLRGWTAPSAAQGARGPRRGES